MTAAKPSLDLLRGLTDEHVLTAFAEAGRLTRAQVASVTGLSKPTVTESVRRLEGVGLLRDSGERTSGRGGVGSYYVLDARAGCALAVAIAPAGITAEAVDAHGAVVAREERSLDGPVSGRAVAAALRQAARATLDAPVGPVRCAVVSAADPVDRYTGRLVQLPDAPFLVGTLAPATVLAPLVTGPVVVDNDVNWAARAERTAAADGALDDFAYLHLGEGLGCAVVSGGQVTRGHSGIAGEISHVVTSGPGGRAVLFTEVFEALGLRRPGTSAIDVEELLARVEADPAVCRAVVVAVGGVVDALVAMVDPACVVVGGSWGAHPSVVEALGSELAGHRRRVPVRAPIVEHEAALSGARHRAVADLRSSLVALAR